MPGRLYEFADALVFLRQSQGPRVLLYFLGMLSFSRDSGDTEDVSLFGAITKRFSIAEEIRGQCGFSGVAPTNLIAFLLAMSYRRSLAKREYEEDRVRRSQ
jgi:hypothetical protein